MKHIRSRVHFAGVVVQVVVLSQLLFLSILVLYSLQVGARIFRYAQF